MGCRKGYENDTGSARPQQAVKTKLIITKKERSGYEREATRYRRKTDEVNPT